MLPETSLAEIFRDYIATADAVTAGLPATTVAARRAQHDTADKPRPVFTAFVERVPQSRTNLAEFTVNITLEINSKKDDVENSAATDPADAENWMDKLRDHLLDTTTFFAFIAAQDADHRTGYLILDYRLEPYFKTGIKADQSERNYMQTLILTCRV